MKVSLTQSDIDTAVRNYLSEMMPGVDASSFTINYSMTRGADGLIADLTNTPVVDQVVQAAVPTSIKEVVRRPRQPKPTLTAALIEENTAPLVVEPELVTTADIQVDSAVTDAPFEADEKGTPAESGNSLFSDPIADQIAGSAETVPEKRPSLFG